MSFEAWALPAGYDLPNSGGAISLEEVGWSPLTLLPLEAGGLLGLMALLRKRREEGLARIPTGRVVEGLDRVARRLLDPRDLLRTTALEALGAQSGFSGPMVALILDRMAQDWRRPGLERLLASEFPDPGVLDGFRSTPSLGAARAAGYPLTFHLGAGTVPGVGATSLVRALLVKSAALLKPGRGDVVPL